MNTQLDNNRLVAIYQQLQQLVKKYLLLKKENIQLTKKIAVLDKKLLEKENEIQEQRIKMNALQLSVGGLDEEERKTLSKKVGEIIREIDRSLITLKLD